MFIETVHRDYFNFYRSYWIFVFLGLNPFMRWNTDHVKIEFLEVLWNKWWDYFVKAYAMLKCVVF